MGNAGLGGSNGSKKISLLELPLATQAANIYKEVKFSLIGKRLWKSHKFIKTR